MATTKSLLKQASYYRIQSKATGGALEVQDDSLKNGAFVCMGGPVCSDSQLWQVVYSDDSYFMLLNKHSGKALDTVMTGVADGTWLHQWEDVSAAASQLWTAEKTAEGCYKLISKLSGKCMDIAELSNAQGAHAQIWKDLDGAHQKWYFSLVSETGTKRASRRKTESAAVKKITKRSEKTKKGGRQPI